MVNNYAESDRRFYSQPSSIQPITLDLVIGSLLSDKTWLKSQKTSYYGVLRKHLNHVYKSKNNVLFSKTNLKCILARNDKNQKESWEITHKHETPIVHCDCSSAVCSAKLRQRGVYNLFIDRTYTILHTFRRVNIIKFCTRRTLQNGRFHTARYDIDTTLIHDILIS